MEEIALISREISHLIFSKKILVNLIQQFLMFDEKKIFSLVNSIINDVFNESIKIIKINQKCLIKNISNLNKFINLELINLSNENVTKFYNNIDKINLPQLQNIVLKTNEQIQNYDKLTIFNNLKIICLEETKINNIDFIVKFKYLKEIHLINNSKLVTKDYEILVSLAESINIYLSMKGANLINSNFLSNIKNIEELILLDNGETINNSSIILLKKHKYLKKLYLDNLRINNLSFINDFKNLIELSLTFKYNDIITIDTINNYNNLKKLHLINIKLNDYKFLEKLKNLEDLSLINKNEPNQNINIKNNIKLSKINLVNFELGGFSSLKDLIYLKELSLSFAKEYFDDISVFKSICLKKLYLKNISIKNFSFIINFPNLEELKLYDICNINLNFSYLNNSKKLKVLEINELIKYNKDEKEIHIKEETTSLIVKEIFKINLIKDIKILDLSEYCNVNDIPWKYLTEVEELSIKCPLKKQIKAKYLTKLSKLNIGEISKSEKLFLINEKFLKLEEINLLDAKNIGKTLELFSINSVKKISINNKKIDIDNKTINLSLCSLENINFINSYGNKLNYLEKIYLEHNNLENVDNLKIIPNIIILNLTENNLNNINFLSYPSFTNLTNLSLRRNIHIENFKPLNSLKNIKYLDLSMMYQKDISFLEFINTEKLSMLDISGNKITEITPTLKKLMDMSQIDLRLTNNYEINFPNRKVGLINLEKHPEYSDNDFNNVDIDELDMKILLLGDSISGKKFLMRVLMDDTFDIFEEEYYYSLGIHSNRLRYFYQGTILNINVFDIIIKYNNSLRNYKSCDGFIVVFNTTNRRSFNVAKKLIDSIDEYIYYSNEKVIYLVGNEIRENDDEDVELEREISKEEANEFARKNNIKYFEISCANGTSTEDLRIKIITDIYNIIEYKKHRYNNYKKNKKECSIF